MMSHEEEEEEELEEVSSTSSTHVSGAGTYQEEEDLPVVEIREYGADVDTPSLMQDEALAAAVKTQFLTPTKVSLAAQKPLLRPGHHHTAPLHKRHDALLLFALLRPHPTRW
jgi:hypothetical protein